MDHWCAQETAMVLAAVPFLLVLKMKAQLIWSKLKAALKR